MRKESSKPLKQTIAQRSPYEKKSLGPIYKANQLSTVTFRKQFWKFRRILQESWKELELNRCSRQNSGMKNLITFFENFNESGWWYTKSYMSGLFCLSLGYLSYPPKLKHTSFSCEFIVFHCVNHWQSIGSSELTSLVLKWSFSS